MERRDSQWQDCVETKSEQKKKKKRKCEICVHDSMYVRAPKIDSGGNRTVVIRVWFGISVFFFGGKMDSQCSTCGISFIAKMCVFWKASIPHVNISILFFYPGVTNMHSSV